MSQLLSLKPGPWSIPVVSRDSVAIETSRISSFELFMRSSDDKGCSACGISGGGRGARNHNLLPVLQLAHARMLRGDVIDGTSQAWRSFDSI